MTLHLPDFSIQVVEAFIRSLDRGETVIQQKYFSQLKDLYEVLGITQKDGVGFPSIYGAQRTPAEEEHSETPEEMKTEEGPDQVEPEGGIQVDDPSEERVDEEDNVVEDNYDGGDNQDVNKPPVPRSSDDVVRLLGDDDDESDFEIASQPEVEDNAERPLADVDVAADGEMNDTRESHNEDTEDFFNDMYAEPTSPDIRLTRKYQIKLNSQSPKINPDPIKLTKTARVLLKKIKPCGNKRKFDVAINPPQNETIEKKKPTSRSTKRTVTKSKSRETLTSPAQPLKSKVPVSQVLTNTPSPEKSKRRRKSSLTSAPKISSEDSEYKCPVRDCHKVVKPGQKYHKIYKLLKHVIQKHLSEPPLKLYDSSEIRYPRSKTRYKCHYCDKINESSNSMFCHMALHHDDLFIRVQARLREKKDPQKLKSILNNINGYLSLKWNRWAQCQFDNVKENLNKSKIVCAPIPKISVVQESKETFIKVDSTAEVQQDEAEASEAGRPALTETPKPPPPTAVQRIEVEKRVGKESSNTREDEENNLNSVAGNSETPKSEPGALDLSSLTIICKHCDYPYTDDEDLRNHLLGKHSSLFYEIKLLEGGEKFYECEPNCQSTFRTKKKLQFAKHLRRAHEIMSVELIADKESWNSKQLRYRDFCYVTNNKDMLVENPPVTSSQVNSVSNMEGPASVEEIILEIVSKDIEAELEAENVMKETQPESDPDPCLQCPYLNCAERFPRKNELLNHYLSKHQTSSVIRQFLEILHPETSSADLTNLKIGEAMLRVFLCIKCTASFVREDLFIDHCSFHQNPQDLIQCEHCVGFIQRSEIEAHSSPAQCPHFEERKRLLKLREVRL